MVAGLAPRRQHLGGVHQQVGSVLAVVAPHPSGRARMATA
jgi:hypothetical protein